MFSKAEKQTIWRTQNLIVHRVTFAGTSRACAISKYKVEEVVTAEEAAALMRKKSFCSLSLQLANH